LPVNRVSAVPRTLQSGHASPMRWRADCPEAAGRKAAARRGRAVHRPARSWHRRCTDSSTARDRRWFLGRTADW